MNKDTVTVTSPFTHENLSIFLIAGSDACDGSRFIPLDEAMEQKCVVVHETGDVGQLEVENLSDRFDLYIQAGEVVKGGRQDRTIGVDFVLPSKTGRTPIPSYCVESGRWHLRAGEDAGKFSSSKDYLASKKLRMAAKLSKSQDEVWDKVSEVQADIGSSLKKSVHHGVSPSSYQLSVEDPDLAKRKETFRAAFAKALEKSPNAIGYAFVINGEINTADVYGSHVLFQKLWNKLLDAAILEAIAESHRQKGRPSNITPENIHEWLQEGQTGEVTDSQEVAPRLKVATRRSKKSVMFETRDRGLNDAMLNSNLVNFLN